MNFVIAIRALIVGLVIIPPVIYLGASPETIDEERERWENAIIVALFGIIVSGIVNALLGWIPVIGVVLAPLVWVVIIKRYYPATWPIAGLVGLVSWALPQLVLKLFFGV